MCKCSMCRVVRLYNVCNNIVIVVLTICDTRQYGVYCKNKTKHTYREHAYMVRLVHVRVCSDSVY